MAEIYIAVLSGFLFGIALSIVFFPFFVNRKLEKEQFSANLNLYRQLLLKKQDRKFEYSHSIRKVINSVHVALLVENQNKSKEPKTTLVNARINERYEPSL